jgi:hypothetical protein
MVVEQFGETDDCDPVKWIVDNALKLQHCSRCSF